MADEEVPTPTTPPAEPAAPVVPPTPPSTPKTPAQNQQGGGGEGPELTGVDSNKLMAAISYLGLLVIVPLLVSRQDKFVMWHAKQGLIVLIGYIIASILAAGVAILGNILWLLMIIVSIVGFVQAMQGKWWKVPVVGKYADKFKF